MVKTQIPSNSKSEQKKRKAMVPAEAKLASNERKAETNDGVTRPYRTTKKVLHPVNSRSAKIRKPSFIQKVGGMIFGETSSGIGAYLRDEVLIPAFKDTIQSFVTNGIDMILFGETRRSSGRSVFRGSSYSGGRKYTSYSRYSSPERRDSRLERSTSRHHRGEYARVPGHHNRLTGIVFESEPEAEEVLVGLLDALEKYEVVSILDFYELAGIANLSEYTDDYWGWENLADSRIVRTKDGWEIEFPKPVELTD